MYNHISVLLATQNKEHLKQEIEKQIELGGDGLKEWDKWMLEVNLNHINYTLGKKERCWLIAISTAHETCRLRRNNMSG